MPGKAVPELNWPETKNGQSHRVWLTQPVLDLLSELDGPQPFAKAGKISNAMIAICKKLEVERATPHDLRRTFSTKVCALGFSRTKTGSQITVKAASPLSMTVIIMPMKTSGSWRP